MPLAVLSFGNYLLPIPQGAQEAELDGYDGFFDQAFYGMKEGDPIDLLVNELPQEVTQQLWQPEQEAPFALEGRAAARAFHEVMRLRYLATEIREYHGDSSVVVRVKYECPLSDFADGTRRPPPDGGALAARVKEQVARYRREREHASGFWPDEACPLPATELLRRAERDGVCGVGLGSMSFRRRGLLVKQRRGAEAEQAGPGFVALLLGSNDRDASFLIEIPSLAEYEALLNGYAAAAESQEEARIWKSRLSLRALD